MNSLTFDELNRVIQGFEEQFGDIPKDYLCIHPTAPEDHVLVLSCVNGRHRLNLAPERARQTIDFIRAESETCEPRLPGAPESVVGMTMVGIDFFYQFMSDQINRKCTLCQPEGVLRDLRDVT